MFIEYELFSERGDGRPERGLINVYRIAWIEIETHGGGFGESIQIHYFDSESVSLFMEDNKARVNLVYDAFKYALHGKRIEILNIGYFNPIHGHICNIND